MSYVLLCIPLMIFVIVYEHVHYQWLGDDAYADFCCCLLFRVKPFQLEVLLEWT